jgi:hypothetical protein
VGEVDDDDGTDVPVIKECASQLRCFRGTIFLSVDGSLRAYVPRNLRAHVTDAVFVERRSTVADFLGRLEQVL